MVVVVVEGPSSPRDTTEANSHAQILARVGNLILQRHRQDLYKLRSFGEEVYVRLQAIVLREHMFMRSASMSNNMFPDKSVFNALSPNY